jgi:hypothetical protein
MLVAHKLYKGRDCTGRLAPKAFATEILFIDWLEAMVLPRNAEPRENFAYNGPMTLVIDEHSIHVRPRLIALCGSRKIILSKLVPHSSHFE